MGSEVARSQTNCRGNGAGDDGDAGCGDGGDGADFGVGMMKGDWRGFGGRPRLYCWIIFLWVLISSLVSSSVSPSRYLIL